MRILNFISLFKYIVKRYRHNRTLYIRFKHLFTHKYPKGDKYQFSLYHAREVISFLDKTGYEKLYLVGDNWVDNPEKPIAMIFGCNDWKLGFLADYLKDYRCAFSPRKLNGLRALYMILKLRVKPSKFFVWGYNDSHVLRFFLDKKNVIRIEDGFIRSSKLGAEHTTPYSLVFDSRGLHYNHKKKSDIEVLLNNYIPDGKMLDNAKMALDIIKKLKISKYNPVNGPSRNFINLRKRVAVIGQVYSDASIKYGNPNKYTFEEVILKAIEENPGAEILYRPHPEVYSGYQKNQKKGKYFDKIVKIADPTESIVEFLDSIDHVYVISSLTGLDALIRGIKVTVLGQPFYCGWGLTDDRVKVKRRTRTLSLLELFSIVYLKYPKYLANTDNPFVGLLSAAFRIVGEKSVNNFDYFYKLGSKNIYDETFLKSKYFVSRLFTMSQEQLATNFNKINFAAYLVNGTSVFFDKVYVLAILGILKNESLEDQFLVKVRASINYETFNQILKAICFLDRKYLSRQIAWLKTNTLNEFEIDKNLIKIYNYNINLIYKEHESEMMGHEINFEEVISEIYVSREEIKKKFTKIFENGEYKKFLKFLKLYSNLKINDSDILKFKDTLSSLALDHYMYLMANKQFDKALLLAEWMLVSGCNTLALLNNLANYAALRFDFISLRKLAELNQNINFYSTKNNMSSLILRSYLHENLDKYSKIKFLSLLATQVIINPSNILLARILLERLSLKDDSNYYLQAFNNILHLDNENSLVKAQSYIMIEESSKAVKIMDHLVCNLGQASPNNIMALTQALSYAGKINRAIDIIEIALEKYPIKNIMQEAIRLYVLKSNYTKCMNIYDMANKQHIKLGDMQIRKTFFGNRIPAVALEAFKQIKITKELKKYLKDKYVSDPKKIYNFDNVLILSVFGPGDELRFSSIYNILLDTYFNTSFIITCSPKLYTLFVRSFPLVTFVSVNRLRNTDHFDIKDYDRVYGSDLTCVLDNNGVDAIDRIGKAIMVSDLLGEVLKGYEFFSGKPHLFADEIRIREFQRLLPPSKKLVGLSWRSSLTTHSRNEHYLTIEELKPLFTIDGIQFVNLQYDECSEELALIDKLYPGKFFHVKELDQYNDIDGVAALLKCMDLIIAPATTVVELAGALGCNTWMFSNSSEIDWRKIDDEGTDVWFNSVKIVDIDEKGDKIKLVQKLYDKLLDYSHK